MKLYVVLIIYVSIFLSGCEKNIEIKSPVDINEIMPEQLSQPPTDISVDQSEPSPPLSPYYPANDLPPATLELFDEWLGKKIEKTLKSTITINNHKLIFADFFLDSLDYREKWTKNRPSNKINLGFKQHPKVDELRDKILSREKTAV